MWENTPPPRAQQWTCSFCVSENFFLSKAKLSGDSTAQCPPLHALCTPGTCSSTKCSGDMSCCCFMGSHQPTACARAAGSREASAENMSKDQYCALCCCSPAPCIPRSVLEVAKAGPEHQWQGPAAGRSRCNACCGAVAVGVTTLLPGSTPLLPRGEEQNA